MKKLVATLMLLSLLVFGASANAFDVYKPGVPDVDKPGVSGGGLPGAEDKSCWLACAANLLGGGGWGVGDTVQERANNIYNQLTGHIGTNLAGHPEKDVDLLAVARSVGRPTRTNCGQCHFKGGGGDAVKHGDLDGTMYFPQARIRRNHLENS